MEEMFEIRSCIEILANDIKVDTTDQYALQLTKNYKIYTVSQKNCATFLRPITLEILNRSLPNWA